MASIRKEVLIQAPPETVWDAIRDYGAVHQRVAPGFVVDARLDGDDRVVTFFNGLVIREVLVDLDDESRRLVYSAIGGSAEHHNASFQVLDGDAEGSRVIWIADFLPHDLAEYISAMMDQGAKAMKQTLELQQRRSVRTV
jgi:carbon monoxide dehydrogenase subunit G